MTFGHKKMYIGGELIDAADDAKYDIICPGDEQVTATIAWAGKADTERALAAARQGFEYWSDLPVAVRVEWMHKLRNKLIEQEQLLRSSIMYEMGKVWAGTAEDFKSITDSLAYYAREIEKITDLELEDRDGDYDHRLVHQPLGVVVAFVSYNFPLLNLGFKLGPALAAGCSIIIKPSEFSPLSAYIIGELCAEIGFPAGVINILCGDVQDVGIPLSESKIPRLITMIGSTETAQKLIMQSAATSIKRYSMECGGNAPFIVTPTADVAKAAEIGAALKIGNSGQICVAPNRYILHESVADEFIERMQQAFTAARPGFGKNEGVVLGPLANRISVKKTDEAVQKAVEQGGKILLGGQPHDGPGYYYPLTMVQFDDARAPILQHEVFGPVAFLLTYQSPEQALEIANDTEAGLASYVFSRDEAELSYFARGLAFGEVQLNGVKYDINLPHGGVKNSGIGVDCSPYALDDYLIRKRISKALA